VKGASPRIGAAAFVLIPLLTLCTVFVPAAAAPHPDRVPPPFAHAALVARHTVTTTRPNGSTTVPPDNAKKGVRLGPVLWALPAVAVLCAAVATPLALRRRRERAARRHADDDA
jgi:hypothetical protein